jgi:hypothetical protein
MKSLLAIARLTVKAAIRMKLIPAVAVALLILVGALPYMIETNGTAEMLTQVVLTYSISIVTLMLGLATIWLSCSTMAGDIGDAQMQVVATKPVARWQIWLGKWLGIVALNGVLLALSGVVIVTALHVRAKSLSDEQQDILRSKVMVARGTAKEARPFGEKQILERMKQLEQKPEKDGLSQRVLRMDAIRELTRINELVPSGRMVTWEIDVSGVLGRIQDRPLHIRTRFYAANFAPSVTNMTLKTDWEIGQPGRSRMFSYARPMTPEGFHEFQIPANLPNSEGIIRITFANHNPTTLLFPLEDGLELLYPASSFGMNFARALGVILCWLGLLAAVGLCGASFLSFPVATFLVFTLLIVISSGNLITEIVTEGSVAGVDHETGKSTFGYLDWFLLPLFRVLLFVVNAVQSVSPIESLSAGRIISWAQLGTAFAQITLLVGGVFAIVGSFIFTRRELAAAQSNQ